MDAPTPPTPRPRGWLSWPALAVALVALPLAAGGPWIAEQLDPPAQPVEEQAADVAVRVRDRVRAKLRGEAPPPAAAKPFRWGRALPKLAIALAVVAIMLAAVGLARGESPWVAGPALGLGAGGLLLQWLILLASLAVGGLLALFVLGLFASLFQGAG